jgi:SAM-dependent methyltransferase
MEHAGMVHALNEIHRTLKPGGILLDLRPVESNWAVEVTSRAGCQVGGRLEDQPSALADDEAANQAIREAEAHGWYVKEKEEEFDFFYYWDTPSEMKEFIETEWGDFEKLAGAEYRKTASLWVAAGAEAAVRVRVKMLAARWKKI